MKKVKMRTTLAYSGGTCNAGGTCEVEDDLADRLVESGQAEYVDAQPAPVVKDEPKQIDIEDASEPEPVKPVAKKKTTKKTAKAQR